MIKTIDTNMLTKEMLKAFYERVTVTTLGTLYNADDGIRALLEAAPAVEPVLNTCLSNAKQEQSGWLRAIDEALVCHHVDVANSTDTYEQAKDKLNKLLCVVQDIGAYFAKQEPAQAVPVGYRLQSIAEFDAINEWIASNDDLTIAYMRGKHDQKAIDHDKKQKALHFVRWIASLKTGGLIQARANDLLKLLEAG